MGEMTEDDLNVITGRYKEIEALLEASTQPST